MLFIKFIDYLCEFFFFLTDSYLYPSAQKSPVLVDSQIQSSPFTCLLTVCRVFYLDETLLWAGYVASRGERAGDYMEENAELLSQVVARRD